MDLFAPEHGVKQHLVAVLWWTECTERSCSAIRYGIYILRRQKVGFFFWRRHRRKVLARVGNNAKGKRFNQVLKLELKLS